MAEKQTLCYLGYCVNESDANNLSGASIAGNNMQLNVLRQLNDCSLFDVHCFTIYPVASFPKDRSIYYTGKKISLIEGLYSIRVGFLNLPLIKQLSQAVMLYSVSNKLLNQNPNATIFTYNMFPQVGIPAWYLRKKYSHSTLITLLADPPIDDMTNRRIVNKLLFALFFKITRMLISKVDKLIVLNIKASKIYAPKVPSLLMEGGVSEDANTLAHVPMANRKMVVVFSGRLIEYNGVIELIKAMDLISIDDVQLHIYGDGPLKEKVVFYTQKTHRIKYMGYIYNNTVKQIQRNAYLLVNPRPVDDPISQVTFPSKIFEYLVSGTPTLTTRLNGFTEEYLDKMFFAESNDPAEMAKKIDEIMNIPFDKLDDIAKKARNFVLKEKSWGRQMERVIDFIKEVES